MAEGLEIFARLEQFQEGHSRFIMTTSSVRVALAISLYFEVL